MRQHITRLHGRPQKFFQGGQRQHFAGPCQVADDAMQMYVHETFQQFSTITKENAHVSTIVTKVRFAGSHSQVYYHNFYNRLYADFQSKALFFTEVLPRSLMKSQITTLFYLARLNYQRYSETGEKN